ncbi:DUF285 domain-containing protein, partial [Mycobacterium tuberculosis]|nr:DUF285 domain-containing protein [Mycobacterium tuberculosis]
RSTSLDRMFTGDSVKNDLTKWDVSSVTSLIGMFSDNMTFNQPIGNWNVSNVTNRASMLSGASTCNRDVSSWSVSKVTTMFS